MSLISRGVLSVALVLGMAGVAFADSTAKSAPAVSDDLSLIPVDSEIVGGLDWAGLLASPLWQKYVEPQFKSAMASLPADFATNCGDPAKVMSRISFGLKNLTGGSPEGVIVMYGVTKTKMIECMTKSKSTGPGTKLTRDGDYFLVTGSGNQAAFTFLNDKTFFGVLGPQGTKEGVKKAALGGSSLKTSPTFVELYGKTKTADTMWVLINGNSKIFDGIGGKMPVKPKAVYGSINVAKDLTLDGRVRVESASQASTLSGGLNSQAGQLAMFVDKLNIGSDGADITISAALSEAKLKALIGMVGGGRRGGP
jgi:hypothetical protein